MTPHRTGHARARFLACVGVAAITWLLARAPLHAQDRSATPGAAPSTRDAWIEGAIDSTEITVGSPAVIRVRVHAPQDATLGDATLPLPDDGDVVLRNVTPGPAASGAAGERVQETFITVTAYATGAFMVPPVRAVVTRAGAAPETLRTDSLRLTVRSVLPAQADSAKLHDIKEIRRLPGSTFPFRVVLLTAAAVLALIALGWWLRKRLRARTRRVPVAAPPVPAEPPGIVARRALAELRARGLHQRGLMDEFYTALTAIIRVYIGDRFRFAAIDMTTTEILGELEGRSSRGVLTSGVTGLARSLLDEADLVKFAKGHPGIDLAEAAFARAEELITLTEPIVSPRPETALAGGEGR